MNNCSISLIILCYNDGPSISELVKKAYQVLEKYFSSFEIIITDDGSQHETINILNKIKESYPSIIILKQKTNKGVGANFTAGVKATKNNVIAYIDGDGQYTPDDLPLLYNHLKANNMVSGLRVNRKDSIIRKIATSIYNQTIKILYNVKCKDVNSGIKMYNRNLLLNIQIESSGPFYDAEIIIKHIANNSNVIEIPIQHFHRKYGKARGISLSNLKMTFNEAFSSKFLTFRKN